MKRKLFIRFVAIVLLLCMIAPCMPMQAPAYAASVDTPAVIESRQVDSSTREALDIPEECDVLRIYSIRLTMDPTEKGTLLAALGNTIKHRLAAFPEGSEPTYYWGSDQDGWGEPFHMEHQSQIDVLAALYNAYKNDSILKSISADIQIKQLYLIEGATDVKDCAIYYVTNLGEYVFYYLRGSQYLFSLDAFLEFQQQRYYAERLDLMADRNGRTTEYVDPAPWDLSAFDFTSADFDPNAPVRTFAEIQEEKVAEQAARQELLLYCGLGAVMILFAGAAFLFFRKKKAA